MALDVWSYSGLIKGYVQSSDLDSALEVLQDMKQANHVLPNEVRSTRATRSSLGFSVVQYSIIVGFGAKSCKYL